MMGESLTTQKQKPIAIQREKHKISISLLYLDAVAPLPMVQNT
jgi:hypothetical protein